MTLELQGKKALVFPGFTQNPYTHSLYSASIAAGLSCEITDDYLKFLNYCETLSPGDVCHIQWTHLISQSALTERDALKRVSILHKTLRKMAKRGVKIIWTIHNRLPHELKYPQVEIDVCKVLSKDAHYIHVMNGDTASVVSDVYKIDDSKVITIPHPSYIGKYPASARKNKESLSNNGKTLVVLFLGHIRGYKGLETLTAASTQLIELGVNHELIIAGQIHPSEQALASKLTALPEHVHTNLNHVSDEDVAKYFEEADICVFPYKAILNSGSIPLAATMGKEVLIPDFSHLVSEYGGQSWVHFYNSNDPVNAIAGFLSNFRASEEGQKAALQFAELTNPALVSLRFKEIIMRVTQSSSVSKFRFFPR